MLWEAKLNPLGISLACSLGCSLGSGFLTTDYIVTAL